MYYSLGSKSYTSTPTCQTACLPACLTEESRCVSVAHHVLPGSRVSAIRALCARLKGKLAASD